MNSRCNLTSTITLYNILIGNNPPSNMEKILQHMIMNLQELLFTMEMQSQDTTFHTLKLRGINGYSSTILLSAYLVSVILRQSVLVAWRQLSKMTLSGKKNKTVKVHTYLSTTEDLTLRLSLISTKNSSKENNNYLMS